MDVMFVILVIHGKVENANLFAITEHLRFDLCVYKFTTKKLKRYLQPWFFISKKFTRNFFHTNKFTTEHRTVFP